MIANTDNPAAWANLKIRYGFLRYETGLSLRLASIAAVGTQVTSVDVAMSIQRPINKSD